MIKWENRQQRTCNMYYKSTTQFSGAIVLWYNMRSWIATDKGVFKARIEEKDHETKKDQY